MAKANKPKDQHTITKAYLDGFANPILNSSGKTQYFTYLYDKQKKEYYYVNTKDIMKEVHFYSMKKADGEYEYDLETFLATQVEAPYKKLITLIRADHTKLSDPIIGAQLIAFLSYLPCRTTKFARVHSEVKKMFIEDHSKVIKRQIVKYSQQKLLNENGIKTSIQYLNIIAEESMKKNFIDKDLQSFKIEALHRHQIFWRDNFTSRNWILIHIPTNSLLITSDNPMNGYAKPSDANFNNSPFPIALANDLLFIFDNSGNEITCKKAVNLKFIKEFNDYIALTAERFIVCNNLRLLKRIVKRLNSKTEFP